MAARRVEVVDRRRSASHQLGRALRGRARSGQSNSEAPKAIVTVSASGRSTGPRMPESAGRGVGLQHATAVAARSRGIAPARGALAGSRAGAAAPPAASAVGRDRVERDEARLRLLRREDPGLVGRPRTARAPELRRGRRARSCRRRRCPRRSRRARAAAAAMPPTLPRRAAPRRARGTSVRFEPLTDRSSRPFSGSRSASAGSVSSAAGTWESASSAPPSAPCSAPTRAS